MKRKVLILIDIQNIYFTPGPFLLHEPEMAARNAAKILKVFREAQMPVIHVKHLFPTQGYTQTRDFLLANAPDVAPILGESIVEKNFPNSFLQTTLRSKLLQTGCKDLVIAGMMSHMCVDTTVRECQNYGYQVTVPQDACATMDLKFQDTLLPAEQVHRVFMAALGQAFATVTDTDNLVEELIAE